LQATLAAGGGCAFERIQEHGHTKDVSAHFAKERQDENADPKAKVTAGDFAIIPSGQTGDCFEHGDGGQRQHETPSNQPVKIQELKLLGMGAF
jgi:hypothetical protein